MSGIDGNIGFGHDDRGGDGGNSTTNNYGKDKIDIRDGNWHHVVGIKDGLDYYAYLDGEIIFKTVLSGNTPNGSSQNLHIGHHGPVWNSFFKGLIDDVRIYNRSLSANEVSQLYDFEKPSQISTDQTVLLDETFDGNINDNWTVERGNVNVNIETGILKSSERGTILSKNDYPSPKVIKARLRLDGWPETATLKVSTNGQTSGGFNELLGISVHLNWDGNAFSIQGGGNVLASTNPSPSLKDENAWIDLVIADTGNQITATINNSTTLTADVTNIARYGNKIAYYSREFGSGGSVDYIKVEYLENDSISSQTSLDNGLVAYYPFNGNANDESENNNGTVNGASLTNDKNGNANSAYYFDNQNEFIRINDHSTINIDNEITLAAWVRPDLHTHAGSVIQKGRLRNNWDYGLSYGYKDTNSNKGELSYSKSSGNGGFDDLTIEPEKWQHIAVTVDESSNEMVFYRNGVKIDKAQKATGGSFDPQDLANVIKDTSNGGNLIIGNNNDESQGDGGHFSGAIDEVRIYKRALSAEEISQLYDPESTDSSSDETQIAQPTSIDLATNTDEEGNYEFNKLVPGDLYISSYADVNQNGERDLWEPVGSFENNPLTINSGESYTADLILTDPDLDGDGLPGYLELFTHNTSDNDPDSDDDGINDGEEVALGTDPLDKDTDDDGVTDRGEILANTDPKDASSVPTLPEPILQDFEDGSSPSQ